MSKQTFRVVEMTVVPGQEPTSKTIKANLPKGKAVDMRDTLQEKVGDFTPDKVVSYLVQPA